MMNRKQIALMTGLTIISGINFSNNYSSKKPNVQIIKATQKNKKSKYKTKYPDIMNKLDITSMQQYESNMLFMNISLKDFYIKDFSLDSTGKTHLLLAPLSTSNQYFLAVTKTTKSFKRNQRITIQGFLNGKTTIKSKDNFNSKYLNQTAVSILVDHIK